MVSSKGGEESLMDINKNWETVLLHSQGQMFVSGFSDALVKNSHEEASVTPSFFSTSLCYWTEPCNWTEDKI